VLSGEVRYRFTRHLYALAQGGRLLFARPDAQPTAGAFASLGVGVDHVR
jgi:hypothetical protein